MDSTQSYEEWCQYLRGQPDKDVIAFRDLRCGGARQQAGITVWQEREDTKQRKIRNEEFQMLAEIKQKRESEHTLLVYWRLANSSERLGMVGVFAVVFVVGYLCAKMEFVSRFIDLMRSIKP